MKQERLSDISSSRLEPEYDLSASMDAEITAQLNSNNNNNQDKDSAGEKETRVVETSRKPIDALRGGSFNKDVVDKTVARIEKKNRWKVRLEERYAKIKAKKAASVKVDRKVDGKKDEDAGMSTILTTAGALALLDSVDMISN
ncbi:hypothetical protein EB796_018967 [Bugula neritina]|uniref:Uncharacterized protein n=1 Tax=Bugula neritina TaxID=10212 RepID=A0A7J7JAR6_BUGNE|nr:hypothetical protein EB796_018967 [Bugula neritina]